MRDRVWIIRPSEQLRLALGVCTRGRERAADEVELKQIGNQGCAIAGEGLLLQIGQPVALSLPSGDTLKGTVAAASDHEATIDFDNPLPTGTVRAIRLRHTAFLSDIPNLDLTARRSVA